MRSSPWSQIAVQHAAAPALLLKSHQHLQQAAGSNAASTKAFKLSWHV
jgi:hypothetical protein